jgi:hypothetical protein
LLVIGNNLQILRICCCNITVLNAHAPNKEKSDASKYCPYEEKGQVSDHLSKHHMKILTDFNVKLGREDIFKPTIGNESLHQNSTDNCVRIVKCATSKTLVVKRLGCSALKHS